jgi:RNA polymerase sigma-70 factor (ECF subfamily)
VTPNPGAREEKFSAEVTFREGFAYGLTRGRAMGDPDAELMDRYARGDLDAFDALFRRYDRRAFGFLLRRTRCPDRAADLHQELFLRVHRFRIRFDPTQPFAPWFFEVARNVWHDDLRRRHRLRHEVDGARADDLPAGDDPERRVADRELTGRLLASLAPAQRALVVGTAVEGLSYPELAGQLGRSVVSLKQAGSRALRRLRRFARERA